jgi:hypothetical protein
MPARAMERTQCSAPLRVIPRTGSGTFTVHALVNHFWKRNLHEPAGSQGEMKILFSLESSINSHDPAGQLL